MTELALKAFTAEMLRFSIRKRLTEMDLGARIDVAADVDRIAREVVAQISILLPGRMVEERGVESVEVPVGWWDALRLALPRRLARWLGRPNLRRIETKRITYHVCPHVRVSDARKHLEWMAWTPNGVAGSRGEDWKVDQAPDGL